MDVIFVDFNRLTDMIVLVKFLQRFLVLVLVFPFVFTDTLPFLIHSLFRRERRSVT